MTNKNIFNLFFIMFFLLSTDVAMAARETVLVVGDNQAVSFDARILDAFSNMNITNVSWSFGDGLYGYGITINHAYSQNWVYEVNATTTDVNGKSHSTSLNVISGVSIPFFSDTAPDVTISFVSLPAGTHKLTIEQTSTASVSTSGFSSIGKFFSISSDLPNGGFNSLLIFRYSDSNNDGIVDGTNVNEGYLNVYYYDSSWKSVVDYFKSTDGNYIAIATDHFTQFALLAPISSQPSNGTSGSGSGGSNSGSGISGGPIPSGSPVAPILNNTGTSTSPVATDNGTSSPTSNTSSIPSSPPQPAETTGKFSSILDNPVYSLLILLGIAVVVLTILSIKVFSKKTKTKKKKK